MRGWNMGREGSSGQPPKRLTGACVCLKQRVKNFVLTLRVFAASLYLF